MQHITPSTFDVIVLGTGLIESIIAAAAAKSGRSVLQLEEEDGYGGPWASLHLDELRKVAARSSSSENGFIYGCKLYELGSSIEELGSSRGYSLDVSPHVIHGVGPLIKILLGSGAHNYTEYKLIKTTVIRDPRTGKAQTVPCSRAEIFRDQNLSPLQKRTLMRFLKAYTAALNQPSDDTKEADFDSRFISKDVSFVSLLNEIEGMDEMLQRCLVHGVLLQSSALQDDDNKTTAITCQAAARLVKMYTNSLGRYGIDAGPFLIPMHGFGELPQAFCRTAAVHGAVQVLRCGVDKYEYDSGAQLHRLTVKGTNQQVTSQFLAATARLHDILLHSQTTLSAAGAEGIVSSLEEQGEQMAGFPLPKGAVHRCIAVMNGPTQLTSEAHALLIIPPTPLGGTLTSESACNTVWGLQLGPGSGVTPTNTTTPLWVLHLWCESNGDFTPAEQALLPCLKTLVSVDLPPSPSSNAHVDTSTSTGDSSLPRALFVAFFSIPVDPKLSGTLPGTGLPKGLVFCPGPTSEVGVVEATDVAKRLYFEMLFGPDSDITAKYSNYDITDEGLEDDFPLSPEFTSDKSKQVDGDEGINGGAELMDELSQELAALQNALGLTDQGQQKR